MVNIKTYFSRALLKIQNVILCFFQKIIWIKNPNNIKNILIYKIGNIGDVVTAYPSIKIIKSKYPQSKISLLTSPGNKKPNKSERLRKGIVANPTVVSGASILKSQKMIDEIILYQKTDLKSIIDLINQIRKKEFDRAFVMSANNTTFIRELRNLIFFAIVKIKYVRGFSVTLPIIFKRAFSMREPYLLKNEVERNIDNLNLNTNFDKKNFKYKFLNINNALKEKIQDFNNALVIAHGSKFENRKWNEENFYRIAKKWIIKNGDVIFIGANDDRDDSNYIISKIENQNLSENKLINFCGNTSLEESIFLIQNSSAMIANCSGPAHLASFTDTKVVTIQSSYNYNLVWGSYFSRDYVLRPSFGICNCNIKKCRCIDKIHFDEAWKLLNTINE